MEAALINKRFVLHLALLGTDRQAAARKEQQRHNAADARKEFQMVVHRQWGRVGLREGGLVDVHAERPRAVVVVIFARVGAAVDVAFIAAAAILVDEQFLRTVIIVA